MRLAGPLLVLLALLVGGCVTDVDEATRDEVDVASTSEALTTTPSPCAPVAKPEPDPWKHPIHGSSPITKTDVAQAAPSPWRGDDPAEAAPAPEAPGTEVSKPEPDPWSPGAGADRGTTKK